MIRPSRVLRKGGKIREEKEVDWWSNRKMAEDRKDITILRLLCKLIHYGNPISIYLFKRVNYFKELGDTFKISR